VKLNVLFTYFFLLAGFFSLSACSIEGARVITPEGESILIELAVTREEQVQGLMFREHLDENAGMLFVFEEERGLAFWMKNTLIPLDVLYLDANGTIVDIHTMQPCPPETLDCPNYPSQDEAQYALEINAGRAEELGLEIGETLEIILPATEQ
jgi:uncharacterized membrane protein (UPF0127 family)